MNSKDYERHLLAKEAGRERELLHQQEVEKRMRLERDYEELAEGLEVLDDIEDVLFDALNQRDASGVMDTIKARILPATEMLREDIVGQLDTADIFTWFRYFLRIE